MFLGCFYVLQQGLGIYLSFPFLKILLGGQPGRQIFYLAGFFFILIIIAMSVRD